ncbi:MAG: hypothetical protein Q8Q09_07125 [Deltaproteobacteria bacterium]|nr:hypothetical protein [Deltaproteobacteria bacterium]
MNTRFAAAMIAVLATSMVGDQALAQRRGRRPPVRPPVVQPVVEAPRVIPLPVLEVYSMFQRQRVWLFTPPAGTTAFGLGGATGDRVWALLPSCRAPNPDDPRDPCPVGRVTIEVATGTGQVSTLGPTDVVSAPNSRRVQGFVIPATVEIVRIKLLRNDGTVRYEAVVHRNGLANLPAPEGQPAGERFRFDLTRYPAS